MTKNSGNRLARNGHATRRDKTHRAEAYLESTIAALTTNDLAIDCGANIGKITRKLVATGASVIAFEPDPIVFAVLKSSIEPNPNVTLRAEAVGTERGTSTLFRSPYYDKNPLLEAEKNTICRDALTRRKGGGWQPMDKENVLEVQVIDLPDFIRGLAAQHGRVSLLKLDIEGMELPILETLEEHKLFELIGFTVAELHPWRFPNQKERIEALRSRIESRYSPAHVNLDWG